jgi:hypothetical protein
MGTIDLLQQQKKAEGDWTGLPLTRSQIIYPLTLDIATTTKVFDKVKSILA